jgi:hypothetical protein
VREQVIEHFVLLKPNSDVRATDISALWAGIDRMRNAIPGIASVAYGENISSEGKDRGFAIGFIITFEDRDARDNYLPHPEHLAVVPLVHAIAAEVLVFDIER